MLFATVRQRKVHVKQPVDIIQNGIHVDTVMLDMDDEWAGMTTIIATFTNGETAIDVNYTFGQPLDVPWECLQNTGTLTLHFTGYVGSEKVMTTMLPDSGWNVVQNGEISEQTEQEATPTLLQQITEVAQSVRDDADAGEFDGAGVPEGGTAGQFLKKKSGTDYDTEWADTSAPVTSVNGMVGAVELNASNVGALPNTTVIPAALHQLTADSTHRTVTDAEKTAWNAKQAQLIAGENITIANNVISASGGGGTNDHDALINRDADDQHPISAITGLSDAISGKQDSIVDLETIRSGAALGATAVQPEAGKGLFSGSYNDLTDKPTIPSAVTEQTVSDWGFTKNTGTYSKPSTGIPKTDLASDVKTSLGKADTALQEHQSLAAYRTASAQDAIDAGKQDVIDEYLATVSVSGNTLSIKRNDGTTLNFTPQGGGGGTTDHNALSNRDLANQHPISAITGLQDALDAKMPADTPIPAAVTEQTVSGWGFTKNTGTYSKPSGGIPKSDLASAVQTSLGKADSALQSFTESDPVFSASAAAGITSSNISAWNAKGTYSKPSGGIPKTDLASAVQTSLGKADSALQSVPSTYRTASAQDAIDAGKQDAISDLTSIRAGSSAGATALQPGDLSDWAKQANKPSYTASEVGARSSSWTPTKSQVGLGNVDNVRQYSASNPPPYPVTSVNGQTGDVAVSTGTASTTQQITLTVSGWTTSGSYKVQTVSVSGVTESTPVVICDVNLSGSDKAADDAMLEAWIEVLKCYVDQGDGTLTFHAEAVPTVNISVKVAIC